MSPEAEPNDRGFQSLDGFLAWARSAPPGTQLEVGALVRLLEEVETEGCGDGSGAPEELSSPEPGWRERLWTAPAETRLGTAELGEALGRPKSWIYARTRASAKNPIPHAKLDGSLVFKVGEIRAWLREREKVEHAGPMESSPAARRLRLTKDPPSP